jgi:hypothetical protein
MRNFFEHKLIEPEVKKESNSDDKVEESIQQHINCFKCGGTKFYKKKICNKCNGSSERPFRAQIVEQVSKDVRKLFSSENFKQIYNGLI